MTVEDLLKRPEGPSLDFKRDLSSTAKVVKTAVAMVNTAGGHLVLGVDDDRAIVGLDPFKEEERFSRAVADSIEPLVNYRVHPQTVDGKDVLVIQLFPGRGPFYIKSEGPDGGVYRRMGSTNQRLDPPAVAELRREMAAQPFDSQTLPEVKPGRLDRTRIEQAFEGTGTSATRSTLQSLGLLARCAAGEVVATYGGVILFGKDEVRAEWAPDARVRCVAFRGETKIDILDEVRVEGTVLEAIPEAERFLDRNSRHGGRVTGLRRRDLTEYAAETVRELIVNAVAHADYSRGGSQLLIALYSNRLEIQSPGQLPYGTTVETLKAGISNVRNRAIVRVLHELRYMEQLGSGYQRIAETFVDDYPEPDWQELGSFVRVVVPQHPHFVGSDEAKSTDQQQRSVAERRSWILEQIDTRGGIKVPEIAAGLGVSQRTAERDAAALVASEEIRLMGSRKTGRYQRQR